MSLGLPPVSTGLKSIAPYLQRAEELVEREPVIAYWCAYYAAQLGISLKAQDTNSRNLLPNVLDALERLKKEIGPNDAIDIEPASAAYVENFALKVFRMADDEDRAGKASKSTAKKFLAAANFFEVLRAFPETDVSESSESKLKYAKWKAADIAKAFREGRRPTPGPAGSQLDPEPETLPPPLPPADELASQPQPSSPPKPAPREPSPPVKASRSPKRQSPPPSISVHDIARANQLPILLEQGKHDDEALSPGRWSTTATPGFDLARTPGLNEVGSSDGSSDSLNNWHEHVVDPMSRAADKSSSSKLRRAWVSTEMEDAPNDEEPVEDTVLNGSRVRFSPPSAPTFPTEPSPPRHVAQIPPSDSPPFRAQERPPSPPLVCDLPPGFVPTGPPIGVSGAGLGIYGSPTPNAPPFFVPPPPPPVPHSAHSGLAYGAPSLPVHVVPSSPPVSAVTPPPAVEPIRVAVRPPTRPVELTPSIIAKAQKHCKFAISALDYEDAAHAIKELKDALRLLGGGMSEY